MKCSDKPCFCSDMSKQLFDPHGGFCVEPASNPRSWTTDEKWAAEYYAPQQSQVSLNIKYSRFWLYPDCTLRWIARKADCTHKHHLFISKNNCVVLFKDATTLPTVPQPDFILSRLMKQTSVPFLQKINVKTVHPVCWLRFKPMSFRTRVSSHNHYTRALGLNFYRLD